MLAAPVPPPLPPPARRKWPWVLAILGVIAVGLTAILWRPFPTEEERKYFGWWYGWQPTDDTNARAWIAEMRENGELHLQHVNYTRKNTGAKWEMRYSGEIGTWRVRKGMQRFATENPERPIDTAEKIRRFSDNGHWKNEQYYRTLEINEREMRYEAVESGVKYHSLRSNAAVTFPTEPLSPEKWKTTEAKPLR